MSYDRTGARFEAVAGADAQAGEDALRADFLCALDEAGFEVSDFEAGFIESFLEARLSPGWWTPGRRKVADGMRQRYAARLPAFRTHAAQPPQNPVRNFPKHVPGECGYLERNDDRQLVRCGKPVKYRTNHGLEICEHHKKQRDAWRAMMKERRRR